MILRWISAWALLVFSASAWAVSPYVQGDSVAGGNVQAAAAAVETKLKNGGFKVVGKYFPKSLAGYGVVIATDDAMLMERVGHPVHIVSGDYDNIKITTPEDLVSMEGLLARRAAATA